MTLPEIPVWEARTQFRPMTTLWAIWTRLSILVFSPITVSSAAPRSTVAQADVEPAKRPGQAPKPGPTGNVCHRPSVARCERHIRPQVQFHCGGDRCHSASHAAGRILHSEGRHNTPVARLGCRDRDGTLFCRNAFRSGTGEATDGAFLSYCYRFAPMCPPCRDDLPERWKSVKGLDLVP